MTFVITVLDGQADVYVAACATDVAIPNMRHTPLQMNKGIGRVIKRQRVEPREPSIATASKVHYRMPST